MPLRRRAPLLRLMLAYLAAAMLTASTSAHVQEAPLAAPPARVVSINACADQLLFKLARRDQIAALSAYAADPAYSIYATEVRASGIPLIRGTTEEILKLRPNLVFAGAWTSAATRERIARHNIPLVELAPDESIAATFAAIERMARLLGREEQGAELARKIREALDASAVAPPQGGRPPLSALQLQRRGFVSGRQTLTGELMRHFGLINAADRLGIATVDAAPLEAVLKARPDVLIVLESTPGATDQGAALLEHPALVAAYPPGRRIVLPGPMTACGGPALAAAAETLSRGLAGLR